MSARAERILRAALSETRALVAQYLGLPGHDAAATSTLKDIDRALALTEPRPTPEFCVATIAATLQAHPDGLIRREIAEKSGLGRTTVSRWMPKLIARGEAHLAAYGQPVGRFHPEIYKAGPAPAGLALTKRPVKRVGKPRTSPDLRPAQARAQRHPLMAMFGG